MFTLLNDALNTNYLVALILNYIIGYALYRYVISQKKQFPEWEIPKQVYGIIASFFVLGIIPVINQLLLVFVILVVCYFIAVFIITLAIFEFKNFIQNFFNKNN